MRMLAICITHVFFLLAVAVASCYAQERLTGHWVGSWSESKTRVYLKAKSADRDISFSFTIPMEGLTGLTLTPGASEQSQVHFELVRDAGNLVFNGQFRAGTGSGDFAFIGNREFVREMAALGFEEPSPGQLLRLTIHNISLQFVKDLKALGYDSLSINQLIRMRIHGVTADFVRELKELGYEGIPVEKLVKMRIHGVTVEFIKQMRDLGYANVTLDQLIRLRIHGIDANFVRRVKGS